VRGERVRAERASAKRDRGETKGAENEREDTVRAEKDKGQTVSKDKQYAQSLNLSLSVYIYPFVQMTNSFSLTPSPSRPPLFFVFLCVSLSLNRKVV